MKLEMTKFPGFTIADPNFGDSNDNDDNDIDDENDDIPPAQYNSRSPHRGSWNSTDFLINYNKKYKKSMPTMFRDSIIHQTLSCLIGKFKPNALLVGAAGVGKTKIVEDIARMLAANDPLIPDQLAGYTIWELPLSNIVSGSGIVGDIEEKTQAVLAFASNPKNKVILFIDEVHMLLSGIRHYDSIAQMMKPVLARNDTKFICATTLQEVQNLMQDPAFNRRFTRLIVDELSQAQTIQVLQQLKNSMCEHYENKVVLTDDIIEEIISIADEYKTMGSHRPDNAITLLDRAMADAFINKKIEEKALLSSGAAKKSQRQNSSIELDAPSIRKVAMKIMTGNNEKTEFNIDELRSSLSVIKGQDKIVEYMIDVIERDNLNIFPRIKPLTLLFAGNSGVG